MNITPSNQVRSLTYDTPVIRRREIGRKPEHKFDQNPNPTESYVSVSDDPFRKGSDTVWASLPDKNSDGTPVMVSTQETVDLRPRSSVKYGAVAGGIGVVAGAGIGALASGLAGVGPVVGAVAGGLAIGGIAGGIAAYSVHGEKTKLVWDEHQITDHKMVGYRELVGPGQSGEKQGHFHRYIADVESQTIGSYKTPRVVRYKGEEPPQASAPLKETPADQIPKGPSKDLDVVVTYETERLQSRYLGSIPHDYRSYFGGIGGYTSCDGGRCSSGGRSIYRNTPVYEPDREPRVDTVTRRVQASPYSVPLFATGGAVLGGGLGFGAGMLLSHFTGLPSMLTAGIAAGVAGLGAGFAAGNYAAGDAVKLEWREYSIDEKKLDGYYESVTPHYETRCRTVTDSDGKSKQECETVQEGWDHTFRPDISAWSVGSYVGPKVVHYQKD